MSTLFRSSALILGACAVVLGQSPKFAAPQIQTNRENLLSLNSTAGQKYRLQFSTNLVDWQSLTTLQSTGIHQHTDSATPFQGLRFYRAFQDATNALTGDYFATTNGDVLMHLFNHASFLLNWSNKSIYVDPTVTTLVSQGFPRADLILITHDHSDHFQTNGTALRNLTNANTAIIAPLLVSQQMAAYMKDLTNRVTVLTNGAATAWMGLSVQAVPAYNSNHPQGRGNGYVLTIAGQRIYISGDTGNVVELLQLTNLDYAFVCMDGQYNMKTNEAAQVVRAIHPKVVYPYHYNTAKPEVFKSAVGADLGIEVRLRKWE